MTPDKLHEVSAILIQHEGLNVFAQVTIWDDDMRKHVAKVLSETLSVRSMETTKKCLRFWINNLDIIQVGKALQGDFTWDNVAVVDQIQCLGSIGRVLFYIGELSRHNVSHAAEVIIESQTKATSEMERRGLRE